jgi:hypothetical protein
MTTLNVPMQLRRGLQAACPSVMLPGEVYLCLDTGLIFAGTGTGVQEMGGGSTPSGVENLVYATPNGSSGSAFLRALVSSDLPTSFSFGLNLINAKFISVNTYFAASTGGTKNNVYTCPAGRRAYVMSLFVANNVGGTSSTFSTLVNVGGTSYQIGSLSSTTPAGGNTTVLGTAVYVLEAGEVLQVANTTTTSFSVFGTIVEFDNTSPLKSVKLLTLSSGENTIYTVSTGKSAVLLPPTPVFTSSSGNYGVTYRNDSGGTRTLKLYVVPNGGSVGISNQVAGGSAGTTVTTGNSSEIGIAPLSMVAGDSIVLSTDAATAQQWAYLTVLEF